MKFFSEKKDFFIGLATGVILISVFMVSLYLIDSPLLQNLDNIARAVTFDSDIIPVPDSSIRVGVSPDQISSINNVLFFNGQTIGIGASSTTSTVKVNIEGGGLRFNSFTTRPDCNSSVRGTMWFSPATSTGAKDVLAVCYRNADGMSYGWAEFQGK